MKHAFLASSISLLGAVTAPAATIASFGNTTGAEVTGWRTTSTTKTMDIDNNNFYGSFGAVNWTVGSTGEQSPGSTTPGWAYIDPGPDATHFKTAGYTDIDGVTTYPADTDAGIMYKIATTVSFTFELTGIASTYTGKTVRVGIMSDVLTSGEWAGDNFSGLRINQTVGGSGTSGTIALRGGGGGNGVPEMYFFDLTNVSAGNQFRIDGLRNIGGASTNTTGYISAVSWDIVPEPSSALLGGLGILALLRRRRN